MFYDRTHPNYPFFHRSCKTSLAINLSAFPMHTLNEEKRKRKKRAMNMYDKCIPHSFLLLVWYRYLKMLFIVHRYFEFVFRVPIKPVYILSTVLIILVEPVLSSRCITDGQPNPQQRSLVSKKKFSVFPEIETEILKFHFTIVILHYARKIYNQPIVLRSEHLNLALMRSRACCGEEKADVLEYRIPESGRSRRSGGKSFRNNRW